jgi:hypothetical protein
MKRKLLISLAALFLLMNVVAAFHAWKLTHFTDAATKTPAPEKLSLAGKLKTILLGVSNPRPTGEYGPLVPYGLIHLPDGTECWYMPTDIKVIPLGTVALFHGYSGDKSKMLVKAYAFRRMGYNVLLADFRGSGGSPGNSTTVGYKEAAEVLSVYKYLRWYNHERIILFGSSMGAAAILRAVSVYQLPVDAIITECPFGSMYQTVCARFGQMGVPAFPMAGLLTFWGGVENGFWAFGHKPTRYARGIRVPTLLLWGQHDPNVSRQETEEIYQNLAGPKSLHIFARAGHEITLKQDGAEWQETVSGFLNQH